MWWVPNRKTYWPTGGRPDEQVSLVSRRFSEPSAPPVNERIRNWLSVSTATTGEPVNMLGVFVSSVSAIPDRLPL
jgi:hypothetical protein